MRGPRPAAPRAYKYSYGAPGPRVAEGTARRLWPVKAAGPAAKIVWRRSCTCFFSNRAGLSDFTRPGRQHGLEKFAAPAVGIASPKGPPGSPIPRAAGSEVREPQSTTSQGTEKSSSSCTLRSWKWHCGCSYIP